MMRAVMWRDGRVAEGAPLLRAYRFTPIEGSNPSLSATLSALSRCVLQVVDSPRTNPIIRAPRRCALVAQLDRVPGYEPGGRRFESSRARHFRNLPRSKIFSPPISFINKFVSATEMMRTSSGSSRAKRNNVGACDDGPKGVNNPPERAISETFPKVPISL